MWMGVRLADLAVRRPARVANAETPRERLRGEQFLQLRNPADGLLDIELAIDGRQPGAVVAAIFEARKSFKQNGLRLALPDVTDDAAHRISSVPSERRSKYRLQNGARRG